MKVKLLFYFILSFYQVDNASCLASSFSIFNLSSLRLFIFVILLSKLTSLNYIIDSYDARCGRVLSEDYKGLQTTETGTAG